MIHSRYRSIAYPAAAALLMTAVSSGHLFAAAEQTDEAAAALKAYQLFLTENETQFEIRVGDFQTKNTEPSETAAYFLTVDLDQDGIPELVTEHLVAYKQEYLCVYSYIDGEVKRVDEDGISLNCQANGYYGVYACREGHLHVHYEGGSMPSDYQIYTIEGGRLVSEPDPDTCISVDTLQINEQRFRSLLTSGSDVLPEETLPSGDDAEAEADYAEA